MASPGAKEQVIATMHVASTTNDERLVAGVVRAAATDLGLTDEQGAHLAEATGTIAHAIRRLGFDDPDAAALDLTLLRSGHRAMVHIDDLGLPFNAAAVDADDADVIARGFTAGWIDGLLHEWRGRQGNRTTLVRHLDPGADLRATAEDLPPAPTDPISVDVSIDCRRAVPADAEAICRLTWRTYGYTYQHDEYYQPARLAALLAGGRQASFVSCTPDGEVVAHSAVILERADDVIVEGGRAMVDPRFRGHHLMGGPHALLEQWMHDHGVLALEGAGVTGHTRSQTDRPVTSVQLAFLPPIEFRAIEGSEVPHRQAVVGGLVPCAPIPPQSVNAPHRDAEMLAEIYRRNELDRRPTGSTAPPAPDRPSELALSIRGDLGHAVLTCTRIGADLRQVVRARRATIERSTISVAYADLPLDQEATSWAADVLADEGFVFCGVMPLAHRGVDVVRYQWLGDTVVDPSEIHLKHEFSHILLDYILAQRGDVGVPS